jgi:hypothetical protein
MQRKLSKRKVAQKHGGLSLCYAEVKLAEKARKEEEKEKNVATQELFLLSIRGF